MLTFGFGLLVFAVVILYFYRMGTAVAKLSHTKDRLAEEVTDLNSERVAVKNLAKAERDRLAQQIGEYRLKFQEERDAGLAAMRAEFAEDKHIRAKQIDKDLLLMKSDKLLALEKELAEARQTAVDSLNAWVEREKARLQLRLDTQYEEKTDAMQIALEQKMLSDLVKIGEQLPETTVGKLGGEIESLVKDLSKNQ